MKRATIFILVVVALVACKKEKKSQSDQNQNSNPTVTAPTPVVNSNTLTSSIRKILIEDYTGHTCGNSPRSKEKAEMLALLHKDSVIIIAVHAGPFAAPSPPTYVDDFRTPAGTVWDTYFGISAAGLPKGMINRTSPFAQNYNSWQTLVASNLYQPQSAKLDITSWFKTDSMLLTVKVKTTFLASQQEDVKICFVLTEDNIKGHQQDYSPPSGACIKNSDEDTCYVFNNVLRDSLNGSWGKLLKAGPIPANDTITKQINSVKITKCGNLNNSHLIVFVYNDYTKEILQIEKLKVK